MQAEQKDRKEEQDPIEVGHDDTPTILGQEDIQKVKKNC